MTDTRVATGVGVGADVRDAVDTAVGAVERGLDGASPDLAVVFLGADYRAHAEQVLARLAGLQARAIIGVSAQGVVSDGTEIEHGASLSVWAAVLPGAELTPLRYPAPVEGGPGGRLVAEGWPAVPDDARGLLVFADPFTFPAEAFLPWVQQARPDLPVSGGLASASTTPGENRLLLDGEVYRDGAVALALGGSVRLRHLVSQGCRPVGDSYVVTGAERNVVTELAGETPLARLQELYSSVEDQERELMQRGLHVGLVIDEYAEDPGRGDFLVRNVVGADRESGAVAIGDLPRVGQTLRFHVRDADSADEDLRVLLGEFAGDGAPAGALLFTCNGRGSRLFGTPDHDASVVQEILGPVGLAGFFAAGELGPVGSRSFLHGFTASLLVIEPHEPAPEG